MIKSEAKKNTEKVSNLSYLSETMGGNKKLIKEIMDVFLNQVPEELSRLNKAVQETDFPTIRNFSHTMKSSVSIMGITALASILKEMEDLARNGTDIEKIRGLNQQLNTICEQAVKEIREEKPKYN